MQIGSPVLKFKAVIGSCCLSNRPETKENKYSPSVNCLPPNTAAHLQVPKLNFNGKAKFLFCYYVAARVWGTDKIVILPVRIFSAARLI